MELTADQAKLIAYRHEELIANAHLHEELTVDQQAKLAVYRHAAERVIGSSCEPADRSRAEAAITATYALIEEHPPVFVWCASPAAAIIAQTVLRELVIPESSLGSSLESSLGPSLGILRSKLVFSLETSLLSSSLPAWIRWSLRELLSASFDIERCLLTSLEASFGPDATTLWPSLQPSVESSLGPLLLACRSSVKSSLDSSLWSSLDSSLRSSLQSPNISESSCLVLYAFCRDVMGVPYAPESSKQLDLWSEVGRSTGWWWPFHGLCFVSDRPSQIHWEPDRDSATRRLHCINGPALAFRDGWDVHCVRGLLLPRKTGRDMASGELTARQILEQPNAEVRRVLVDVYGGAKWIQDVGANVIHTDVDWMGRPRRLLRIEQSGDESYVAVAVTNSTPEPDGSNKTYVGRCHPDLRPHGDRGAFHTDPQPQELTCQNAIASRYGFYGHEYRPVLET